jgi:polysaccharide biosynthesis protein PslH
MKIIFISSWFPFPPDNGSKIRISNLLKGLSNQHRVTFITSSQQDDYQRYLPLLTQFCEKVFVIPCKEYNPLRGQALLGYFQEKPRSWIDTYSRQMEESILSELTTDPKYDLAIYSEINSLNYQHLLPGIPGILEDLELGTYYDASIDTKRTCERIRKGMTWWKTSHYISRYIGEFQACTVVSSKEKEILKSIAPGYERVMIIPNGIAISEYQKIKCNQEPNQIIFSGSLRYPVNYEAVKFFVEEIFPILKRYTPEVKLLITGNQDGVDILPGKDDPRITYTGYVEDVHHLVACSRLSIAPLKTGGGTRLKILESLALGTPVVASSKGAEGLDVKHRVHLLIADEPNEFAQAVSELINNQDLHTSLSFQGRQLVEGYYDWDKIMPRFLDIVEKIERK